MPFQSFQPTLEADRASERKYHAACAETARTQRLAAEAVNDILSVAQANVLSLAMDAMPEAAVFLAEQAFEQYGWPADDIDECWLDEAGRVTWSVFRRYRVAAQKAVAA